MSIREQDISGLVKGGDSRERFLHISKRISNRVVNRLAERPLLLVSDLEHVELYYRDLFAAGETTTRAFSPLRAAALYLEFLCCEPVIEASEKHEEGLKDDLEDFAAGIRNMSVSLLRAEGGIMLGVEGQAFSELRREVAQMSPETQEGYIRNHLEDRKKIVQNQVENLRCDPSGMFLLTQEYKNMSEPTDLVLSGGVTVSVPRWSPASHQGAELAISLYELAYPRAQEMFQGVVIK